ncbi:MAG: molybdenum cofactor guanylyltransferase MobA [Rhodoferax sp.]|nr:molybdenum cofactor guanylyltransferase MobA [Rhodoferax sp.]
MQLELTGMVLAGGQGSRMGGVDKGLQIFQGRPLALHALDRLRASGLCRQLVVNANRNRSAYEKLGAPVWSDRPTNEPIGPLAGFLTGLTHCVTAHMVTVPCDSPRFPPDLVARLSRALIDESAEIAMASAPEQDGDGRWHLRSQPVFCLMSTSLRDSLEAFIRQGGRKIDRWTDQHRTIRVAFDRPGDDRTAFFNVNTLDELQRLEGLTP